MSKSDTKVTNFREGYDGRDNIGRLADVLKRHSVLDPSSNTITTSKDADKEIFDEKTTAAGLRHYEELRSDLASAAVLVAGELGLDHMRKHKDVEDVTIKVNYGRDVITANVRRDKDVRNVQTGETSIKHGVATLGYRAFGSVGSRGALKSTRDHVSKMFTNEFGS